jgi:hypothetical protein
MDANVHVNSYFEPNPPSVMATDVANLFSQNNVVQINNAKTKVIFNDDDTISVEPVHKEEAESIRQLEASQENIDVLLNHTGDVFEQIADIIKDKNATPKDIGKTLGKASVHIFSSEESVDAIYKIINVNEQKMQECTEILKKYNQLLTDRANGISRLSPEDAELSYNAMNVASKFHLLTTNFDYVKLGAKRDKQTPQKIMDNILIEHDKVSRPDSIEQIREQFALSVKINRNLDEIQSEMNAVLNNNPKAKANYKKTMDKIKKASSEVGKVYYEGAALSYNMGLIDFYGIQSEVNIVKQELKTWQETFAYDCSIHGLPPDLPSLKLLPRKDIYYKWGDEIAVEVNNIGDNITRQETSIKYIRDFQDNKEEFLNGKNLPADMIKKLKGREKYINHIGNELTNNSGVLTNLIEDNLQSADTIYLTPEKPLVIKPYDYMPTPEEENAQQKAENDYYRQKVVLAYQQKFATLLPKEEYAVTISAVDIATNKAVVQLNPQLENGDFVSGVQIIIPTAGDIRDNKNKAELLGFIQKIEQDFLKQTELQEYILVNQAKNICNSDGKPCSSFHESELQDESKKVLDEFVASVLKTREQTAQITIQRAEEIQGNTQKEEAILQSRMDALNQRLKQENGKYFGLASFVGTKNKKLIETAIKQTANEIDDMHQKNNSCPDELKPFKNDDRTNKLQTAIQESRERLSCGQSLNTTKPKQTIIIEHPHKKTKIQIKNR